MHVHAITDGNWDTCRVPSHAETIAGHPLSQTSLLHVPWIHFSMCGTSGGELVGIIWKYWVWLGLLGYVRLMGIMCLRAFRNQAWATGYCVGTLACCMGT